MRRAIVVTLAAAGIIAATNVVRAGMPSVSYTIAESARLRIETLSFFLAVFFLAAFGVMFLWNCLARDFIRLPRLTYGKALAVVTLWGLLFVLVLTMISGARELMTPGAWEQDGVAYRLAEPGAKAE